MMTIQEFIIKFREAFGDAAPCLLFPLYNRFRSGASDKTGPIWFAYGFHL